MLRLLQHAHRAIFEINVQMPVEACALHFADALRDFYVRYV